MQRIARYSTAVQLALACSLTQAQTLEQFDPDTEAQEISDACESTETPRTQSEGGALSRHLLARCKR